MLGERALSKLMRTCPALTRFEFSNIKDLARLAWPAWGSSLPARAGFGYPNNRSISAVISTTCSVSIRCAMAPGPFGFVLPVPQLHR